MTDEEVKVLLFEQTGMVWDDIAAEHDTKCGACRGGTLRLQEVKVTLQPGGMLRYDPARQWGVFDGQPFQVEWPTKWDVTAAAVLRCDRCKVELKMPLHAKERG